MPSAPCASRSGTASDFARRPALDVALAKARIELLEEGDLLGREFDRLPRGLGLQGQPALLAGAELALVQKLLDGDRRHPPAFQSKHGLQPVAAVRRVLERQLQEPRHHLDRRGHRMALRHRRQVLEAIQTLQLEAALPVVEAGPVDAAAAARLADVAEPLGQLQNRHPAMRQLLMQFFAVTRFAAVCPIPHLLHQQPGPSQTARQGG